MKKINVFIAACLLICFGRQTAVAQSRTKSKIDTVAILQALSKVNKDYGDAFAKSDSSLLINAYAPDACILLPANASAMCGHNAFLTFYKLGYKMGVRSIKFKTLALFGATQDFVTEQGVYDYINAEGKSLGKGKYLVVWKRTPAGWRMYRDMFNNDAPPAKIQK